MQAARHIHSLRAHFKDLVDLLLGWSLEPSLPNATRLLHTSPFHLLCDPIFMVHQFLPPELIINARVQAAPVHCIHKLPTHLARAAQLRSRPPQQPAV